MAVKKKKDESTQEKILQAAKKVFIKKGMTGARMQDIADEAGMNKALLHYYFRNKDQLFEMIFKEAAGKLFPKINFIFESDEPLFVKIEKFASEYIDVMVENPYLPMFVLSEIHHDPQYFLERIWGGNRPRPARFLEQIAAEVKKGTIRDISPLQLLMNMISLTVFPFVAKPMFQLNVGLDEWQFQSLMEQRKKEIPKFIIDSIKR